jgi:hypothetical protein
MKKNHRNLARRGEAIAKTGKSYLFKFFLKIESIPFRTQIRDYHHHNAQCSQHPQKGRKAECRFGFINGGLYETFNDHHRAASIGLIIIPCRSSTGDNKTSQGG